MLGLAALAAVFVVWLLATNNFHVVVAGEAYRSAQPSAADIAAYRDRYHIATIINLRDDTKGAWYNQETEAARALGIAHIDFPMSAGSELDAAKSRQLVALMRGAAKPILIHCRSGADRTGLASALFVAAVAGQGEEAAEDQLSLRYGHFAVPYFGTYEMDLSFETMEPWLGFLNS